jgi:hypothetical protein
MDDKLLDKLEKILAKSKGTDNPEEAATFLEYATRVMEESGVTERDLLRRQIIETKVKSTQSVSVAKDWEQSLMWVVAKAFGCKLMFQKGVSANKKDYWARWCFVGQKDKAQLAEYSATYLLRLITKARAEFSVS